MVLHLCVPTHLPLWVVYVAVQVFYQWPMRFVLRTLEAQMSLLYLTGTQAKVGLRVVILLLLMDVYHHGNGLVLMKRTV